MKKVIKIFFLILGLAGLAYMGTCAYANFFAVQSPSGGGDLPKVAEARYSVTMESTGNVLFTSDYDQYGQTIILHGYWERSGKDFKFRDRDLILDQNVYGKITIRERVK